MTVPIYEEIMLYYLQNVKTEETKELLKEMKEHQLEPSSLIYNRALVSLASDTEAVEELLQEMKQKGESSLLTSIQVTRSHHQLKQD